MVRHPQLGSYDGHSLQIGFVQQKRGKQLFQDAAKVKLSWTVKVGLSMSRITRLKV